MNIDQELANKLEAGMKPFSCVVTPYPDRGYIRVWNCYCGSIMGAYNRKLDEVCASLGLKWSRKRMPEDNRAPQHDWEDQARPIEGGPAK